tara:strand:- start:72 stop:497 length:426 start_codon:yes stop_codon:yes gene_type:complete
MYGKKVKLRAFFVLLIFFALVLAAFLVVKSLEENVVYFKSPSEIKNLPELKNKKKIRIGGMVKMDSIKINETEVNFIITDFKNEIIVIFKGSVPNLFEEGKGVVAEGFIQDRNYFKATKILAKHDENYMPPEVKESLKDKK